MVGEDRVCYGFPRNLAGKKTHPTEKSAGKAPSYTAETPHKTALTPHPPPANRQRSKTLYSRSRGILCHVCRRGRRLTFLRALLEVLLALRIHPGVYIELLRTRGRRAQPF